MAGASHTWRVHRPHCRRRARGPHRSWHRTHRLNARRTLYPNWIHHRHWPHVRRRNYGHDVALRPESLLAETIYRGTTWIDRYRSFWIVDAGGAFTNRNDHAASRPWRMYRPKSRRRIDHTRPFVHRGCRSRIDERTKRERAESTRSVAEEGTAGELLRGKLLRAHGMATTA